MDSPIKSENDVLCLDSPVPENRVGIFDKPDNDDKNTISNAVSGGELTLVRLWRIKRAKLLRLHSFRTRLAINHFPSRFSIVSS